MKRLFILTVSFASNLLCALPVGNPMDASLYPNGICTGGSLCDPCDPHFQWSDQFQLRMGFYGDYLFNRKMISKKGGGNIKKTKVMTNAGLMVINLCNQIDIFWTLGESVMQLATDGKSFSSDPTFLSIQYEPYFSWSIGGRATVWDYKKIYVGVESQFFRTRPDIDSVIRFSSGDITYLSIDNKAVYEEWQVGIGCAWNATWAIPYAAVKAATGKLKMGDYLFVFQRTNILYTLHDLIPRYALGYALGVTFAVNQTAGITIEGRFASEKALHVNGQIRF